MKLTIGIILNISLFFVVPLVLQHFGWLPQLQPRAIWILSCAVVGILLTTLVGTTSAGGFHFYRQGVDYCKATFGAALSAVALQVLYLDDASQPPLPAAISQPMTQLTPYVTAQRLMLYISVFIIGLLAAWWTSHNSAVIAAGTTRVPGMVSGVNLVVGAFVYCMYIVFLVLKG
jgi:hypothetical protein